MLGALALFALGSALVGAAQSMSMVIGGRSVQGIGGGAILTMVCRLLFRPFFFFRPSFPFFLLPRGSSFPIFPYPLFQPYTDSLSLAEQTEIIVADLVPLSERGAYFGIIGAVWALASAVGPPIGGALASAGQWRWLFYMNLPLTGLAMLLVLLFLKVKTPQTTMKEKLAQMDYACVPFNLLPSSPSLTLLLCTATSSSSPPQRLPSSASPGAA
jgi:MFS family permease